MFYLQFRRQDRQLFDYKIRARKIRIGRSDSCDVALPGEAISRLHCQIEQRNGEWILSDHSRHGTVMNGQKIDRCVLQESDRFSIGEYVIEFKQFGEFLSETTEVFSQRSHEFIHVKSRRLVQETACLVQRLNNGKTKEIPLRRTKYTIGGRGSDIEISRHSHPQDHAMVYISRGRVMISPKAGPVFLDGQRIGGITPILFGEEIVLGDVRLRVEQVQRQEKGRCTRFGDMESRSPMMQEKFAQMKLFAAHDFPILLTGESGTGKELVARALHSSSNREAKPFVPINCGAIPQNLIESELFGHVKGSFSGAVADKDGAFQQADGGTLFLDELGDLPLSAQVKLLRVLEGGDLRRVGSSRVEFPNVRIIAATNQNLTQKIAQGMFREDLFFRLHVLSLPLPPLRERMEDLEVLVPQILRSLHPSCVIARDAVSILNTYDWPGNIRELRNVLCRAYVLSQGRIEAKHIQLNGELHNRIQNVAPSEKKETLGLVQLYAKHNGNRSAMARELGIPRTTLIYRLQQLGMI